jgi:hypothetical protein
MLSFEFVQSLPYHGDLRMVERSIQLAWARCMRIARLMRRSRPGQAACTESQCLDDFPLGFCTPVRRVMPLPARSGARRALCRYERRFRPRILKISVADLFLRCGSLIVLLLLPARPYFSLMPFPSSLFSTRFCPSGTARKCSSVGRRHRRRDHRGSARLLRCDLLELDDIRHCSGTASSAKQQRAS